MQSINVTIWCLCAGVTNSRKPFHAHHVLLLPAAMDRLTEEVDWVSIHVHEMYHYLYRHVRKS